MNFQTIYLTDLASERIGDVPLSPSRPRVVLALSPTLYVLSVFKQRSLNGGAGRFPARADFSTEEAVQHSD
mgnify:CR=1 FL=1